MRVAIIDDEQTQRNTLKTYLKRFSTESSDRFDVDEFPSGDALLADYRLIYDILIFDIDMPGTNGMDTARLIREKDSCVVILFITNMAQYAIHGYEVEAVDYIIKPIGYYDFAMKFRRAVARASRQCSRELLLETTEGNTLIQVADIVYVETMNHYLLYHIGGEKGTAQALRVRGNMKEQEHLLRLYNFCQIHKSYLVNLEYVEVIRANAVIVSGVEVPIGRAYKNQLMQEYLRFVRN